MMVAALAIFIFIEKKTVIGRYSFAIGANPKAAKLSGINVVGIVSLLYVIVIEVALLPCPLTAIERWSLRQAGLPAYGGGFLEHYLQTIIYPRIPLTVLVPVVVAVCLVNLGVYAWRWRKGSERHGDFG